MALAETNELEPVRKASLGGLNGKYSSEFQRFTRQLKTDESWEEVKRLFLMDKAELQALVDERESGKAAFEERLEKNEFDHGLNLFYTESSSHQMRLQAFAKNLDKFSAEAELIGLKDHVVSLFEDAG